SSAMPHVLPDVSARQLGRLGCVTAWYSVATGYFAASLAVYGPDIAWAKLWFSTTITKTWAAVGVGEASGEGEPNGVGVAGAAGVGVGWGCAAGRPHAARMQRDSA